MSLEHDPVRQKRGPGRDAIPTGPPERAAFSISEFCRRNGISRSMFYKMRRLNIGPRVMSVGVRQLITDEAERDWQHDREAAAATPEHLAPTNTIVSSETSTADVMEKKLDK